MPVDEFWLSRESDITILIVDDDPLYRESLAYMLRRRLTTMQPTSNLQIEMCGNGFEAASVLERARCNVAVVDMVIDGDRSAGIKLTEYIQKRHPRTEIVVATGHASQARQVEPMAVGCFDLVKKENTRILTKSVFMALEMAISSVREGKASEDSMREMFDVVDSEKDSNRKGEALENLCLALFSMVGGWKVSKRERTRIEEIDLVIRNESRDQFWWHFGPVFLVECKNWHGKRRPGVKQLDAFMSKIERRGERWCKLGFFTSWLGVARTFSRVRQDYRQKGRLVVPLDRENLSDMISCREKEEFLKDLVHRYITH